MRPRFDAFFPFKDGLEQAATLEHPPWSTGGSIRDQEVIDAADDLGVSMLFTGHRLFETLKVEAIKQSTSPSKHGNQCGLHELPQPKIH